MSSAAGMVDTGWRGLFAPAYRAAVAVLAGGVLLFATNVYLTTSLLPTAVADIGGQELYAWVMTSFLIAAVVASLFVGRLLGRAGPRRSYVVGFGLFGAGSLIAALAPTMAVLLVGRAVQGLGGGLLTGLAFGVMRQTIPQQLLGRAIGVTSAMWGVGNLVGPSVGGLFAQLHEWRWAFGLLVAATAVLGIVAVRTLDARPEHVDRSPLPIMALALITASAAVVSVAGIVHGWPAPALLVVGAVLLVAFVLRERRDDVRILPAITYRGGNALKWVYISLALLAIGSTTETFIPLFGQELGHLGPLFAGLLGAALSFGWSVGGMWSSNVDAPVARRRLRVIGPGLLAIGLALYAVAQHADASAWVIGAWAGALFVGGAGIGVAFQHGVLAAMSAAADDPGEATRAATGVTTVQMMANALGSALAGVLVNLGGASVVRSTQLLLWTFAAVAVVGIVTATRTNRLLNDEDHPAEAPAAGLERTAA